MNPLFHGSWFMVHGSLHHFLLVLRALRREALRREALRREALRCRFVLHPCFFLFFEPPAAALVDKVI